MILPKSHNGSCFTLNFWNLSVFKLVCYTAVFSVVMQRSSLLLGRSVAWRQCSRLYILNTFFPRRFEKSGFVTLRLSHRQQFKFFLPQKTFYKQFFSYTQDKFESISPSQLRVFKSAEIESAGGACGELETKSEHHVTSLLFLFLGNKKTHGQKRVM